MQARRFSSGNLSGKNPDWYWKAGLHDAQILRTEKMEFEYDYRLRNPIRNSLILHLDASQAMFDSRITAIELKNYKILLDESPNGGHPDTGIGGCYWMQDVLTWENGQYILDLILLGEDDFRFRVRFEDALVHRK